MEPTVAEASSLRFGATTSETTEVDAIMHIAIIGISCRFPGDATNPRKLWDMLSQGRDAWSEIPQGRFNLNAFYHPDPNRAGTISVRGGHFLKEDVSLFDASFFNMNAVEAKAMDPQYRLLLESTYEALENAGIRMEDTANSATGVFVGTCCKDYSDLLYRDPEMMPSYQATGTGHSLLSNRVSYFFNLKGPSFTVDTACSSSLVALHLACQSLRSGESKQAIVGGANIILGPDFMLSMNMLRFFSDDGRSYSFDHRASGYGRGEGVASIILKPLEDAIRAGDPIRAIIRNTGVNQDGKTMGLTLPSGESQEALMLSTYKAANLNPLETAYVESHGTGTPAGDPIEAKAISNVFNANRKSEQPLFMGSIKTNLGHLEGASGLAGVIKTVLILEQGQIPPHLNFEKANKRIPLEEWKLRVPVTLQPWPYSGVKRASVNSFGMGGTNAHAILEGIRPRSYLQMATTTCPTPNGLVKGSLAQPANPRYRIFVLMSNNKLSSDMNRQKLRAYLKDREPAEEAQFMQDLAFTLGQRRSRLPWKVAVSANSLADLVNSLDQGDFEASQESKIPNLGFVFTGQGAQWYAMGRELILTSLVFKNSLLRCERALLDLGARWSLIEVLKKDEGSSDEIMDPSKSQPLSTAIQIALVDLLASWNVRPNAVVGHSSGEIAAAYAAGAFSADSCMAIAYHRGSLVTDLKNKDIQLKGAMLAVGLAQEELQPFLAAVTSGKAVIACINSPASITVSGDQVAICELQGMLEEKKVFCRKLAVDVAYHSHHMEIIASEYLDALKGIEPRGHEHVTFFSSLFGRQANLSELDSAYWVQNMVCPVRFSDALRQLCLYSKSKMSIRSRKAVEVLIEVGPHSALAGPVKQVLEATPSPDLTTIRYYASLIRNKDAVMTTTQLACHLFKMGCPVNLEAVNFNSGDEHHVLTDLPPYSWSHASKFWDESRCSRDYRLRAHPRSDLLGAPATDSHALESRWRNVIRTSELPWVSDHRVQGNIVYPAAGFVVMAIEAAFQNAISKSITIIGYRLREIMIDQALVIPELTGEVETMVVLRPSSEGSRVSSDIWDEFKVLSWERERDCWSEHCRGLISIQMDSKLNEVDAGRQAREDLSRSIQEIIDFDSICQTPMDPVEFYDMLERNGLEYGPMFSNLSAIHACPGRAVGTIEIPNTASVMPYNFEYPFVLHPATLDTCIQTIFPALTGGIDDLQEPHVPTFIAEISVSSTISNKPGHVLKVYTRAAQNGSRKAVASMSVFDNSTQHSSPVLTICGLTCTSLSQEYKDGGQDNRSLCFMMKRLPDINLLSSRQMMQICADPSDQPEERASIRMLERASFYYIDRLIQSLDEKEYYTMFKHHQKFFRWIRDQHKVGLCGQLRHQTPEWLTADQEAKEDHLNLVASSSIEGQVLCLMGNNLANILRKRVEPLSLLTEDDLLDQFYKSIPRLSRGYNFIANYIDKLAEKLPNMRILEIGAGTGGATIPILEVLRGQYGAQHRFSQYDFTDISSSFLARAQVALKDWGDLVTYQILDVERDPVEQGFAAGAYDLVIAANVLHATKLIDRTVKNARSLIKPGGKLVLMEITNQSLANYTIFGNLPGWWIGEEENRQMKCTLTETQWDPLLKRMGFSGVDASWQDYPDQLEHEGSVMISTALSPEVCSFPEVVVVCDDIMDRVNLEKLVENVTSLTGCSPTVASLADAKVSSKIAIVLSELSRPVLATANLNEFLCAQRLLSNAEGVLWVTRGATNQPVAPDLNLITGLARTLRGENHDMQIATLDLDAGARLPPTEVARVIIDVFKATFSSSVQYSDRDWEYAERAGIVTIPRILEDVKTGTSIIADGSTGVLGLQQFSQKSRPMHMNIGTPGLLDSIHFVDDEQMANNLDASFVEIEVKAAGLNFKDIMVAMGQLDMDTRICEFSGIVCALGSKVTSLRAGDRVCGIVKGTFCNYLRCHSNSVQKIPESMGFEVAASIPVAYCTAYYSLFNIARLEKHESVLIHAAAGGLGQAAIMLCQLAGAELYVTVGTLEKKAFLMEVYNIPDDHIFSSRDDSFATGIMRATAGRGVDVILNTVAGDALRSTWTCIASFGRFIELGRRDIEVNSRLAMGQFGYSVTFSSLDLTQVMTEKPEQMAGLLSDVLELLGTKSIKPIQPITIFPVSEIEAAFRKMQTGKHIGKLVIAPQADDVVRAFPPKIKKAKFHTDCSYLLVGGLGGLGRVTAEWMVRQGAMNLIFTSRAGVAGEGSREFVARLRNAGVKVAVYACDISSAIQVAKMVEQSVRNMPPIRGLVQSVMALQDCIFEDMSFQNFTSSLSAKVAGTWNLHRHFDQKDIDFFIMLSSTSGLIPVPGQGAYAAASTFIDAFSQYRNGLGLPAVALDLGAMFDVGYLADKPDLRDGLVRHGFARLYKSDFVALMELAVDSSIQRRSQWQIITGLNSSIENDPERTSMDLPRWLKDPMFSHIRQSKSTKQPINVQGSTEHNIKDQLKSSVSLDEASELACNSIVNKLSEMLLKPADQISSSDTLASHGVDSLVAVEIRNWIARELGSKVSIFDIMGRFSLLQFSSQVVKASKFIDAKF